ncbi:MAG: TerB family tellurite resistance protein [Roseateles asaccharophilus]|uniref:Tellurite resistance protein TerB n=1 Tax=Roseateles asaccharophilus TaxID=582607 RepID=A0A4R6NAZ3_9BURK|nr:TerB family tellurite resistance protein [Roseateles asaccharophilus]MDN3544813.1 TerB family tellurite resistance protein [Roseateles asaccharophilus]TDP12801.1 tellurite resistance protein TerB [Roseateles asaccharophilus]
MRHYPRNSAEAASRLVALALIADGKVCQQETQALQQLGHSLKLGLPPERLYALVQELCEDLVSAHQALDMQQACVSDQILDTLLEDVDQPQLRQRVLDAVTTVVAADQYLASGEGIVLQRMLARWEAGAQAPRARAGTGLPS